MKLSLVTISFNQARYLEQCLASVASQLQPGDEYIVVDPGSRDGSREIIERYAQAGKVTKTIFEEDMGPADGLNRGFAHATGDVFAYLNSDDFLLPGALAYARRFFEEHADIDVLVTPIRLVDADGKIAWRGRAPVGLSARGVAEGRCYYVQQGTFIRAKAFRAAGGFNVANRTVWDFELFADLVLSGARVASRVRPLGAFRVHGESISGSGDHYALADADLRRIRRKARERLGLAGDASKCGWWWVRVNPVRRAVEAGCALFAR